MEIKLDENNLKELVSEAILRSLDEGQRNTLIQGAIAHLLTPPAATSYDRKPASPIQAAFNNALYQVANRVAAEMLTADTEITAKVKSLLVDAVDRLANETRETTVNRIADAIRRGMTDRD